MDYVLAPTIPANTPETDPLKTEIMVAAGTLSEVAIYFPWGCAGLAHVQIWHNERQIFPTNLGASYHGNDLLIEFNENYPLPDSTNKIMLVEWNEDDTYDHTPIVRLTVLSEKEPSWVDRLFGNFVVRKGG